MGKVAETAEKVAGGAKKVAGETGKAVADVGRMTGRSAVGYWRGLTYPFRGAAFVYFKYPELVRFWIWPIFITGAFLVGVTWAAFAWHGDLVSALWSAPTGTGFWAGVLKALHWLVELFVVLVLLAGGLILAILLSNVFAAPFKDLLSEEVERLREGTRGPPFSFARMAKEVFRTLRIEGAKLALYVLVMGPMLLVTLIPVVGQIAYSVVGFLFTAVYFAVDYVDWPASRRDQGLRYRVGMMKRHFWPLFGFGTGVWLFLFVPLLNLLFMPAAVAGGTLLFLDLEGVREKPKPEG